MNNEIPKWFYVETAKMTEEKKAQWLDFYLLNKPSHARFRDARRWFPCVAFGPAIIPESMKSIPTYTLKDAWNGNYPDSMVDHEIAEMVRKAIPEASANRTAGYLTESLCS